ncbi:MAG TPA: SGNH/GDSL hydrolase family protein [Thermoanaerobaculia bacterium]|nr:SGNH/GDSL hydrolase family protein [Thermoanaerobaculia bacterium]
MNKTIVRIAPLALGLALLAAVPGAAQQYDQYVALGDSLTAGWESGCLVQRNQVNSYPAVLSKIVYSGDFEQPLVSEGPVTNGSSPKCLGAVFAPPTSISIEPLSEMWNPLNALLPRPYNNLGMPGAEVGDLTSLTSVNPDGSDLEKISALVLRNFPGSPFNDTNAVQQAGSLLAPAASNALLTLWIGNNNTLGASTSGIVVPGVTLISADDFQQQYDAIIAGVPPGVQLMVATIPDVTVIPFSTTIPPILINPATMQPVLINGSTVPLLGPGDAGYPCTPVPPDQGCALPPGTLVNLPASSLLAQGVGVPTAAGGTGLPLPHGYVDATGPHAGVLLYPDEIALLQQTTDAYNQIITGDSGSGAVVVDMHARLNEVAAAGYDIGGIHLTTAFLTGGIFSFDGVHPSSIGYSVIADWFGQALNDQAGKNFPHVDLSTILFEPNPPNPGTGSSVLSGAGAWGYTYGMWRDVLASTHKDAAAIALPSVSAPPARRMAPVPAAPRTVRNPHRHDDF